MIRSRQRPNIVLFNPEQWRGDMLGHLGNPAAVTPNLDRLVEADGVSFRYAFCQNPACTPSRCSFMSGWYPHVQGHRTMYHMLHPERDAPNLLKILKDNGYFIWWGGKNDLVPAQYGYGEYCHVKFRPQEDDGKRWKLTLRKTGQPSRQEWRGVPGSDTYYSFFEGRLEKGDFFATTTGPTSWGPLSFSIAIVENNPFSSTWHSSIPTRRTGWKSHGTA